MAEMRHTLEIRLKNPTLLSIHDALDGADDLFDQCRLQHVIFDTTDEPNLLTLVFSDDETGGKEPQ